MDRRKQTKCHAPLHEFASNQINWLVAPLSRIPSTAAWLRSATSWLSMSWYSLLVSKMTRSLSAKRAATVFHQAENPAVSVMICS